MNNADMISREAAKSMKVYSKARHEFVVPVASLDWLPSVRPLVAQSNDAINSLADMVLEFGCEIECKGQKCIYNNDSPVLERAFYVLEYYGCQLEDDGTIRLDRLFEFMAKMDGGEDDADN